MSRSAGDNRSLVWLSATAAFAIVGCTWAFAIARYGGPDEPAHIIRAAAVAQGDLLGKPVDGFEAGYRQVTVPGTFASGDPACFRHDEFADASCAVIASSTAGLAAATSAGTAPPWYYVLVGTFARVFSDGASTPAYRMVSVLLCAIVLGCSLARSRRFSGAGWLLAALTPSAWFLFGVVGTSGVEIALVALAIVEAVGRFHHPPDTASLWRVMVPLSICLLLRPAALIDVAVVALVLWPTVPRPITKRCVAILATPLVAVAAATVAWSRWTGLVVDDSRTADADSLWSALRRSLGGIPSTAHQAVGALGWNEFYAPPVAQLVWICALGLAIFWTFTHASDRWWHVKWIVAALLLPTILEVLLHRRIGEIWQGRYSIPFAMAGVLYAATTMLRPPVRVLRTVVAAGAAAEVLTLWHTLRRYMVGLDGSLTLQHAAWNPPLNPWLLIAINAAAIAWLATISGVFQATPGGTETLH